MMDATIRVRSVAWTATTIVLAVICTLLVTQAWSVGAAPGDTDSTFVPTPGCRAFDYRPAPNQVGPRPTPQGAGEVVTQQITGSVGDCTGPLAIPADAVAVAMNVTVVNPTAQSNLRLFPADLTAVPTVSNLNFSAGQAPFPNKVDVKLSPAGAVKIFNANGSVSVLGDIVGYYTNSTLQELATEVETATSKIAALEALNTGQRLTALEAAMPFAVSASATSVASLTTNPVAYVALSVTAPSAGVVTLNTTAVVTHSAESGDVWCVIAESDAIPAPINQVTSVSAHRFESGGVAGVDIASVAGTNSFLIAAGEMATYVLACEELGDGGTIGARNLTAIFSPAPCPPRACP